MGAACSNCKTCKSELEYKNEINLGLVIQIFGNVKQEANEKSKNASKKNEEKKKTDPPSNNKAEFLKLQVEAITKIQSMYRGCAVRKQIKALKTAAKA